MKIILIRHGETKGNKEQRYIGRTDDPLTNEGINYIKNKKYPDSSLVFVSPLKRCQQTCKLIYGQQQPVIIDELKECDFGAFEYKNYIELSDDSRYQAWIDSGGRSGFPDGESMEEFVERVLSGFKKCVGIAKKQNESTISLVVHGGTIQAILHSLSCPHRDFFDWRVTPGDFLVCELDEEEFAIKKIEI